MLEFAGALLSHESNGWNIGQTLGPASAREHARLTQTWGKDEKAYDGTKSYIDFTRQMLLVMAQHEHSLITTRCQVGRQKAKKATKARTALGKSKARSCNI